MFFARNRQELLLLCMADYKKLNSLLAIGFKTAKLSSHC